MLWLNSSSWLELVGWVSYWVGFMEFVVWIMVGFCFGLFLMVEMVCIFFFDWVDIRNDVLLGLMRVCKIWFDVWKLRICLNCEFCCLSFCLSFFIGFVDFEEDDNFGRVIFVVMYFCEVLILNKIFDCVCYLRCWILIMCVWNWNFVYIFLVVILCSVMVFFLWL